MARLALLFLVLVAAANCAAAIPDLKPLVAEFVNKNLLPVVAKTDLASGNGGKDAVARIAGDAKVRSAAKGCDQKNDPTYNVNLFNFNGAAFVRLDLFNSSFSTQTPLATFTAASVALTAGVYAYPKSIPDEVLANSDLLPYIETLKKIGVNVPFGARHKNRPPPPPAIGAYAGAYAYTLSTLNPATTYGTTDPLNPQTITFSGLDVQASLLAVGSVGQVPARISPSDIKLQYGTSPVYNNGLYVYVQLDTQKDTDNNIGLDDIQCVVAYKASFGSQTTVPKLPSTLEAALEYSAVNSYVSVVKQPAKLTCISELKAFTIPLTDITIPYGTCFTKN